ncbi:MAG: tetratricopeptide repeat protein [Pseudomonadota bacterium]|jgi:Flp pilus assembly protein TadD|nr:tetratricopeptide repeat protein [Rubrivivax sp.]MCA3259560.1 tetratricopeptide repeat protein [Rubrivivax sp.]MCE2912080.1 tetratricopeptide repeat protein [Rubrivivax sp.]MCZ8030752.1 tetratricopeptide repeat protein [Rubrivivax sp.]
MPVRPRIAPALLVLVLSSIGFAVPARAGDAEVARDMLARGDPVRALELVDTALLRQPLDATLGFLRGVALMDLQRDGEALTQFEGLAERYPELPEPFNNLALLHARAGRLEPARQALESALRNDPGHRTARANLGLVHLMLARQHWELLAAGGPVDPALARRLEGVRVLLSAAPR